MRIVNYPYTVHTLLLTNGCDMAYVDEGKGNTTLLFIHGLALYSMSWRRNIEYLKNNYRCIAVDLPGNGMSGKGNYPYSIHFFAESIYELITRLGLSNVCIIGHSMGGQTALRLLADHPSCASKLILCAPAGFETFNHFQRGIYKGTVHFLDFFSSEENSLKRVIRLSFFNYPEHVQEMADELSAFIQSQPVQQYRKMIESCIDGMLDEPVFDDLQHIQQKTLVIFGERDALIPNRMINPVTSRHIAEEGVKMIPNARLVMIPKCGHFLQIEKAAEVNTLIDNFLKEG